MRCEAGEVADGAADRRERFDGTAVDRGCGAGSARAEWAVGCGHQHLGETDDHTREREVYVTHGAQGEKQSVDRGALVSNEAGRNAVRTADAHPRYGEAAIRSRNGRIGASGRFMHGGDARPIDDSASGPADHAVDG